MRGRSFNSLLGGRRLGTMLKWARSHRCPCASSEGEADRACQICLGRGRYYDEWSDEFRAGMLSQDPQSLAQMLGQLGGAVADIGDSVLVIPSDAPCYNDIATHDRIQVVNTTDTLEWIVTPGSPVRLPASAELIRATVRSSDLKSIVDTPFPTPGADGRIYVAVTTTLEFRVARLYEVSKDLPRARAFDDSQNDSSKMPKRVSIKRVDWTVR